MTVRAVHLVPDAFDGERMLADDQRSQIAEQHRQRFLVDRAVNAFGAAFRTDTDVVMRERPAFFLRARRRVLERLGPPLFVEMQRIHLVLAIEPRHELMGARELEDFDLADDQRVVRRVRGKRFARESRQEGECGARAQVGKEFSTSHALADSGRPWSGELNPAPDPCRRTPCCRKCRLA